MTGHLAAYALELGQRSWVSQATERLSEKPSRATAKRLHRLGRVVAGGRVLQAHGGTPGGLLAGATMASVPSTAKPESLDRGEPTLGSRDLIETET